MAKPLVGPGKKRYNVTLTQANVERYQLLLRQTGLAGTVSGLCNAAITSTLPQLQLFKDNGTITLSDISSLVNQQMELLENEERVNNVSEKCEEKKPAGKTTLKP